MSKMKKSNRIIITKPKKENIILLNKIMLIQYSKSFKDLYLFFVKGKDDVLRLPASNASTNNFKDTNNAYRHQLIHDNFNEVRTGASIIKNGEVIFSEIIIGKLNNLEGVNIEAKKIALTMTDVFSGKYNIDKTDLKIIKENLMFIMDDIKNGVQSINFRNDIIAALLGYKFTATDIYHLADLFGVEYSKSNFFKILNKKYEFIGFDKNDRRKKLYKQKVETKKLGEMFDNIIKK